MSAELVQWLLLAAVWFWGEVRVSSAWSHIAGLTSRLAEMESRLDELEARVALAVRKDFDDDYDDEP